MNSPMENMFYHPLGLKGIIPWLLIILPFTIPQIILLLQLSLRSVGVAVSIRKCLAPSLVMFVITSFSKRLLPVPYHVLVYAFILFLTISIIGRISLFSALIATIFAEIITACGTIIIIEPLLMLAGVKIQTFLLYNPIGYCLGIILESFIPAVVLFVFVHYKLSLFGYMRKDVMMS